MSRDTTLTNKEQVEKIKSSVEVISKFGLKKNLVIQKRVLFKTITVYEDFMTIKYQFDIDELIPDLKRHDINIEAKEVSSSIYMTKREYYLCSPYHNNFLVRFIQKLF